MGIFPRPASYRVAKVYPNIYTHGFNCDCRIWELLVGDFFQGVIYISTDRGYNQQQLVQMLEEFEECGS